MPEGEFPIPDESPDDDSLTDDALLEIADNLFVELDRAENDPEAHV